jgi:hypothetical protein
LLYVLNIAIIAVVKKTAMLAKTAIWLDAIDHNPGLENHLGINATIRLRHKD